MNATVIGVDRLANDIRDAGSDWSDLDAAASLLEETKSVLLAELMSACPEGVALGTKEMRAKADPVFREHVKRMVEARRVANRARVRYHALQVLADLRRTAEASKRAELRALGG